MFVQSIAMCGSLFENWEQACEVFNGSTEVEPRQKEIYKTTILEPNEARRTSATIRMALESAESSIAQSGFTAADLYSVFVSYDGDPVILQSICKALATDEKFVSPTQFHNSVQNAPSGYWTIGNKSMKGANSLTCGECSLSGGLLEAKALLMADEKAVLLACFDLKSPSPLDSTRNIQTSMSTCMILTEEKQPESLFSVDLAIKAASEVTVSEMRQVALREYHDDGPAAKGLPLLEALSSAREQEIVLPYSVNSCLSVSLVACS